MEQLEPSCIVGGNVKQFTSVESSLAVPRKVKNIITIGSVSSTRKYIPK